MKAAKELIKEAKTAGFSWAQALESAYFAQNGKGAKNVKFTSLYALITTSLSYHKTEDGTEFWLNAIRQVLGRDFGRSFDYQKRPSDFSSENRRNDFKKAQNRNQNH